MGEAYAATVEVAARSVQALASPLKSRAVDDDIDASPSAVSESEWPVMFYSIDEDSSMMLHSAIKGLFPSRPTALETSAALPRLCS